MAPAEQPLPPSPWGRVPQRAARPRREPLTQETIVEAALEVLDADGLDLLSMRHVARTLNTSAATLYWHVGSKDGLLDLLLDRVIGEQRVPDPDPERWQEQLKEVARTMRATIRGHRDVVRLSVGRIAMGPNALRYADRVLAILHSGGVPESLALAGQQLLISVVLGFTIDETGEVGAPRTDRLPDDGETGEMAAAYVASLPADRFPHLVAVAGQFGAADADARFELLLDLFVDGLAQRAGLRAR